MNFYLHQKTLYWGYRGVTQGGPLPPKIFNVVVDAIIRYWVVVVALTEDSTEGLGNVLLRQWWPCHVDLAGEATEGVCCPRLPIQLGRPPDEHMQDGKYGLSAMPHDWPDALVGIQEAEKGDRNNLPGEAA